MPVSKRPIEERLAELDEKEKQIRARKKKILNSYKKEERKKRDHRLYQIGGAVEAYCGEITDLEAFKEYLKKYAYAIIRTQPQPPEEAVTGDEKDE